MANNLAEIRYELSKKYFETITKTGYLPIQKAYELFVFKHVTEILSNEDSLLYLTSKERNKIKNIFDCILNNNCLIEIDYGVSSFT